MGQIQSSIQGLVGATVAGEVVKAKKEKELAEAQAKQQKQLKEEYTVAVEALPKTQEETAKLMNQKKKLLNEKKDFIGKGPTGTKEDFNKELKMRNLALNTLRGQIAAKKIRTAAYKQAIERFKEGGSK